MKSLFIFSGFLLILSFCGCQENQITDPVVLLNKSGSLPSGELIKLYYPVTDPLSGPCEIRGTVYYRISNPAENHYTFNVKEKPVTVRLILALNAELCNLLSFDSRPPWRINGHSEDEFTFIQNRTITVAKNHTISNRNDIVLRIIYNVTIDGVTINKIFLRKI